MKNQIIKLMFAITIAFTAFSCTSDDNNKEIEKLPTIEETLKADITNYSVLLNAVKVSAITNLSSAGSYTLFAPTNASFAAYTSTVFPAGITDAILVDANGVPLVTLTVAQKAELKKLVQNHILGVGTKADDLLAFGYSKTFAPGVGSTTLSMFVNKPATDVLVNGGATNGGATITTADIDASNGIIHKVDAVIKFPTIVNHVIANPDLSSLLSIVTSTATGTYGDQSALLATLNGASSASPLTVFAPVNAAFTTVMATGGFYNGAIVTPTNTTKLVRYHLTNGNLTSSSATSWASADATITTLAATTQKFFIAKTTLKITELPVITVAASNMKIVNIQASNGNINTIDRVLQPILP
ncbi:MAG: fasciclin domain-containing protein [Flavobacterium sp.]|uniref:fasciclin domain-containing protein n=1 Tax=Flavobacterium sp. TaxID=239 RepID=UPI0032635240